MPPKDPTFPMYARDWLAGTAGMTLEAQGAYQRLLCVQWMEGRLPSDRGALARLLGVSAAKLKRLWLELAEHFPIQDDGRPENQRLERVRAERQEFRQKKSSAGSEGARKRWHPDSKDNGKAMADEWPASASASASASQNDSSVVSSGSQRRFARANEETPGAERRRESAQGMASIRAAIEASPTVRRAKAAS